ncbi:amidase-domain-containing protein [Dichotomopilus funicola]|uniref:Glutamyl-tRNA(Gln) amidotransferase subunit A, mitochondrial n=1 Tax=Dichotomopilus funicola TaxID=1934379 RepID=A0AAN6V6L5_9PEZI|nr:amidase-domain-containing protein [Dichotomopilus funicola]
MLIQRRPNGRHLRHVCCCTRQQRRLLNHFISQIPNTKHDPPHPSPPPPTAHLPSPPSTFTLAVKDNIAATSQPTTCASSFLATYHSPFEATIITQLRARGARLIGKTNLDEFGMGSHSTHSAAGPTGKTGETAVPYSAGGSSGGSAAAVAAGEVDLALGTDTGGSVRLPAAYCGVVGFKPSYGMVSRFGVVPYANSLDTVGFLAAATGTATGTGTGGGTGGGTGTRSGVERIREIIVGDNDGEGGKKWLAGLWQEHDPQDPTSLSVAARTRCAKQRVGYGSGDASKQRDHGEVLKGLKFGLPLEYNIAELEPGIRDAWAGAARILQDRYGALVVPVSLPTTKQALAAYYVIAPAEASSNLAKYDGIRYGQRDTDAASDAAGGVLYAASRGKGFGDEVKRRILLGSYTLSSEAMDNYFIRAQRVRRLVRRDFNRVFALDNPLHERETFDLTELDESIAMEDKWGPEEVDFLLCPTAPTLAPRLADVMSQTPVDAYMNDVFTVPASLAGLPAISIPMSVSLGSEDVPTPGPRAAGLQLIGQYWDDARLLAVSDAVLKALQVS